MKLTDKQEKFAIAVARGSNLTEAYRSAGYNCENMAHKTTSENASRLAKKSNVAAKIAELTKTKQAVVHEAFSIDVRKLLQTFFEIAFTDANELISVRAGACRHCWGVGGAYHWKEREYLEALTKWQSAHARWNDAPVSKRGDEPMMPDPAGGLDYRFTATPNPECIECEGEGLSRLVPKDTTKLSPGALHLYRGAQQTKDGLKILFADKDASLDKIARMLGAYDDRLRVDLKASVTELALHTNDPQEAAAAYEKMLAGGG